MYVYVCVYIYTDDLLSLYVKHNQHFTLVF